MMFQNRATQPKDPVQRKIDTLREQQWAKLVAMQQEQIHCSFHSDPGAIASHELCSVFRMVPSDQFFSR
jgi:hypothetical protein